MQELLLSFPTCSLFQGTVKAWIFRDLQVISNWVYPLGQVVSTRTSQTARCWYSDESCIAVLEGWIPKAWIGIRSVIWGHQDRRLSFLAEKEKEKERATKGGCRLGSNNRTVSEAVAAEVTRGLRVPNRHGKIAIRGMRAQKGQIGQMTLGSRNQIEATILAVRGTKAPVREPGIRVPEAPGKDRTMTTIGGQLSGTLGTTSTPPRKPEGRATGALRGDATIEQAHKGVLCLISTTSEGRASAK